MEEVKTNYIRKGVTPTIPGAGRYTTLHFRNGTQLNVFEDDRNVYITHNNTQRMYPKTGGKYIFALHDGELPSDGGKELFGSYARSIKLNNQVFIHNDLLYLPNNLGGYLEFGPAGEDMTELESSCSQNGRSFLTHVSNTGVYSKPSGDKIFFMKCGKMRFIPGDIRPIE